MILVLQGQSKGVSLFNLRRVREFSTGNKPVPGPRSSQTQRDNALGDLEDRRNRKRLGQKSLKPRRQSSTFSSVKLPGGEMGMIGRT